MKKKKLKAFLLGLFLATFILLMGVPMMTPSVTGYNKTNHTSVARVYVWNTEPNITQVFINPDPIELNPGNTTTVNCTAYVWDYNGWQDIINVSGTLYDERYGDGTTADNNYRYINSSCQNCTSADGSGTNASCTCMFSVWYYANNGTWRCNISVMDNAGNATEREHHFNNSKESGNATMAEVIGVMTPDEIDYGNLSVTETSSYIPVNVTNWGNVPINVSVRGWGGTDESIYGVHNLTMMCDLGNISVGYQRYDTTNLTPFVDMYNLTNTSTGIHNFNIPVRTNDTERGNSTNQTYWRLQIPLTVGGYCNGTVIFSATETMVT